MVAKKIAKPTKKSPKKAAKAEKKEAPKVKRPLSSYTFFFMDARKDLIKKKPQMSVAEVGKQVGALWRGKTPKDKEPYTKLAEKDKKRYEAEKAKA